MDQTPTDDARPEWWAEATTPIPAGHVTFEQMAALTGPHDEPSTRDVTFPLAADPRGPGLRVRPAPCKLTELYAAPFSKRPSGAADLCGCGPAQPCERLRALQAAGEHAADGPCGGLPARCPTCIELYLALVGPELPVCIPCGHKHWPWEAHADHQWRDECPYEGACSADREAARCVEQSCGRLGKFAVFGGRAICPAGHAGEPVDLAAEAAAEQESARAWWAAQVHAFRPGPSGACEHRMSDGAICGGRNPDAPIHRGPA